MIMYERPMLVKSTFTPCHCNGNCPYAPFGQSCPACTASGRVWLVPADYEIDPLPVGDALRPEDV